MSDDDLEAHTAFAKVANNATYGLLDRDDRSPDEDAVMIHQAHAAAFHWSRAGGPTHMARAEYLVSRVYGFLGRAEAASYHAARCMAWVEEAGLADFDMAYALEAKARSLAASGEVERAAEVLAEALAVPIADDEDRELVVADINTGPWYGVEMPGDA